MKFAVEFIAAPGRSRALPAPPVLHGACQRNSGRALGAMAAPVKRADRGGRAGARPARPVGKATS